ncbi:ABC transporter [Aspergillus steynii IBT 23096]|uniref:ABC transporter n=1 Tax=Aspergillus steynii IBT 23096 TaxID=1392250 RepID=A0A2I2GKE5_9EURO|nr:ABC transporter [Aspergillus steynii IBT 23096]PLB53350.1 ABC transporter [Aspergillus steynii IBT 23096]
MEALWRLYGGSMELLPRSLIGLRPNGKSEELRYRFGQFPIGRGGLARLFWDENVGLLLCILAPLPSSSFEFVIVKEFLGLRNNGEQQPTSVVLNHVSVEGSGTGSQPAPTVLSAAKSAFGILSPIQNRLGSQSSRPILRDFSVAMNPGEMVLVIGKPGSGCTTFLKTLAGMWDEYKGVQGELTLGGHPMTETISDRPQDVVFCGESDDHFPNLTVMETLRFAIRARCGPDVSGKQIDEMVFRLAKLVGLSHVMNTKVGDAYIRGVSGGERRRVSLAEALATCARLICLDNPTNGLDSSTALEFMEMMHEWTLQSQCVTAMSVYQGSDAIIPYFDKVVVINAGRQIFYGTIPEAKEYFVSLGFEYSPTTTMSDFLNSMSADPEARRAVEGREYQVPRTPDEFRGAFRSSQYANQLQSLVQVTKSRPVVSWPAKSKPFALPLHRQVWQCATRQVRIIISDYSSWLVGAACITVQSLVLGTLFRDQKHSTQSLFIFGSALFYSVLVPALQSMSEFGNTFAQRPLILKHKRYRLYRPIAYAFGLVITDVVWKIAAICYNIPLYFLTGFQRTPGNFFIWFLIVYVEHLALSMFFRSVAVFSPNMNRAVLPVGIFFNMYVLYTGLYVPPPQMQVWLGWLRYLNPLHYGFESAMLNEFGSLSYECSPADMVPTGPGYDSIKNQVCAIVGSQPGERLLSGTSYVQAQYGFEQSNLWRNVGINIAFFIVFAILSGIGMERLKQPAGRLATVFYRGMEPGSRNTSDKESGEEKDDVPPEIAPQSSTIQAALSRAYEHHGTLTWKEFSLVVKTKDGERRLLDSLDGSAQSGHMKALMGVSGAGKTTLLNALAGRSKVGALTGTLELNGQLLPKSFNGRMGYVQQQDIHLPTQSVREALQMTAQLRQSQQVSLEEKYAYVEKVIEWLDMTSIADALIGVPGVGLNLEQRKRVSIGVEMASKPEILFLDEPTSGLDGQSAYSIVRLLRRLADSGQAIVCTIHQPAAGLMNYFDELYLLGRGGRLVYDGPLGNDCRLAVDYFDKFARPCAQDENPAEYFLDVIGAGARKEVDLDWIGLWQQSDLYQQRRQKQEKPASPSTPESSSSIYAAPFHVQLRVVLRRTWLYYWREPDYVTSKLWLNVGNALLNAMSYLNSPTSQRGAYNRVFSSFMSLIVGPPLGLQVQPRFVRLREIFVHREKESLTYHWVTFVISAILVELPYAFVTSMVYWLLWYFPVGYFNEPARAGYSFLMYELFAMFATSLAQLCASLMPNVEAALAANGFFFMFCNTFAGTLSPKPVTPAGWKWYYKLSPLFYMGEGVTSNALYDLPIDCQPSEVSIFNPANGTKCGEYAADFLKTATGYLLNPDSTISCEYCRYKDGQSYYVQYGYDFARRYSNVGVFIGFIAFNFTMVLVMTYLTRVRR